MATPDEPTAEQRLADADAVLAETGDADDLDARRRHAQALLKKASALVTIRRLDEAIPSLDELSECVDDRSDAEITLTLLRGASLRAWVLGLLERYRDADAAYRSVLPRLADDQDRLVRGLRAVTMGNRVAMLQQAKREQEALSVSEALLEQFEADPPDDGLHLVVTAASRRARLLSRLGRERDALPAYAVVVERYGVEPDARVAEAVTRAMIGHAAVLRRRGERDAARAIYDDLIARCGERDEPRLVTQVAWALQHKGTLLTADGDEPAQIAVDDEILRRFEAEPPSQVPWIAFDARYRKGNALFRLDRPREAIVEVDCFLARARGSEDEHLQTFLAMALLVRARLAEAVGDEAAMRAAEDELLERADGSANIEMRCRAAVVLANRTWRHAHEGHEPEAGANADELLRRFVSEPDASGVGRIGRELVRAAMIIARAPRPSRAGVRARPIAAGLPGLGRRHDLERPESCSRSSLPAATSRGIRSATRWRSSPASSGRRSRSCSGTRRTSSASCGGCSGRDRRARPRSTCSLRGTHDQASPGPAIEPH